MAWVGGEVEVALWGRLLGQLGSFRHALVAFLIREHGRGG